MKHGRESAESITIYKSLGLAVQDLTAAKLILDISESKNSNVPIHKAKMSAIPTQSGNLTLEKSTTSMETTCPAKNVIFFSKVTFYSDLKLTICELVLTEKKTQKVCSASCFLYDARTGQLMMIIEEWDYTAAEDVKVAAISCLAINNV